MVFVSSAKGSISHTMHRKMSSDENRRKESSPFLVHSTFLPMKQNQILPFRSKLITLGLLLLLLAPIIFIAGPFLIERILLTSMSLHEGSYMTKSWMKPPVSTTLHGFAFHLTNPEEVQKGGKPILKEVGPFVYNTKILKENIDSASDDYTLTYRPRLL